MLPLDALLAQLAALPPAGAVEAARADQQLRWAAGEHIPAERYLAALPAVAANPADALVLIYGEVLLRTELGQVVEPDAVLARFPQYHEALVPLFEVHRGLELVPPVEPVPPPLIPGYDRLVPVGQGGMGTVYRARDVAGRDVAVKVMRAGASAGTVEIVRFLQEADVLAQLSHPNVVHFRGRGVVGRVPYLVTEWVAGGSLADRMDGEPHDPEWAVNVVRGAALGLGAAHAVGVIHRDVKPGNILLDGDRPKVADFGLARLAACGGTLTTSAEVIGTRRYMPPEQLDGRSRDVGPGSDLFSLGAVLFELLAGRPAFPDGDTLTPPDLSRVSSARLRAVCGRALGERFRSAAEFVEALDSS